MGLADSSTNYIPLRNGLINCKMHKSNCLTYLFGTLSGYSVY